MKRGSAHAEKSASASGSILLKNLAHGAEKTGRSVPRIYRDASAQMCLDFAPGQHRTPQVPLRRTRQWIRRRLGSLSKTRLWVRAPGKGSFDWFGLANTRQVKSTRDRNIC